MIRNIVKPRFAAFRGVNWADAVVLLGDARRSLRDGAVAVECAIILGERVRSPSKSCERMLDYSSSPSATPSERNPNPTFSVSACPNFAVATPFPQIFAARSARVQAQHAIFWSLIMIRPERKRREQETVGLGAEASARSPARG